MRAITSIYVKYFSTKLHGTNHTAKDKNLHMIITNFTDNTACNKDDPVTQYTWITDHSALLLNKVIRPI